ncbi:MAG: hypothetical protein NVSMB1_25840 [Polyangiales bacterium]
MQLANKRVLVVGGGSVAARKVVELLSSQASVVVVAEKVNDTVQALAAEGRIELHHRTFESRDVERVWLVVAATNDSQVNAAIGAAAHSRHIFVNAVDDPVNASAFFASVVRRPPFVIAISSSGELPAMARLLRELLEALLPPDRCITAARALRTKWRAEKTPIESRFQALVRALKDAEE